MEIDYTKIRNGVYQARVVWADGYWRRYTIRKREVGNPSPRGGANTTIWTTYHGKNPVAHDDTLAEAKRYLPTRAGRE